MPYTIRFDKEKNCIRVRVTGELNLELLKNLAKDVSKHVNRTEGCYILNDLREAVISEGILNIYQMPCYAKELGVQPTCKRALVVGDKSSDFYFLETVFINQGHIVKMFRTIEEAEAWLFQAKG